MFGSFELLFGGGLVHFPDCYFGVGFYFSILIQEIEELDFVINVNTRMYIFDCIRMYKITRFPSLNDPLIYKNPL